MAPDWGRGYFTCQTLHPADFHLPGRKGIYIFFKRIIIINIWCLLWADHCLFSSLVLATLRGWHHYWLCCRGKWGTERFNDFPQATQPVRGTTRIWTQIIWLQSPCMRSLQSLAFLWMKCCGAPWLYSEGLPFFSSSPNGGRLAVTLAGSGVRPGFGFCLHHLLQPWASYLLTFTNPQILAV